MKEPIDEYSSTEIQRKIEDTVTNSAGYEPIRSLFDLDNAFTLQKHLFIMECRTGNDPEWDYAIDNPLLEALVTDEGNENYFGTTEDGSPAGPAPSRAQLDVLSHIYSSVRACDASSEIPQDQIVGMDIGGATEMLELKNLPGHTGDFKDLIASVPFRTCESRSIIYAFPKDGDEYFLRPKRKKA